MSLEALRELVRKDAELHKEDVIVGPAHRLSFDEIYLEQLLDGAETNTIGLTISKDGEEQAHRFTDWSRTQLLSMLGVKEKWFKYVDLPREAEELNARMVALDGQRVRLARSVNPEYPVHLVRGLVGAGYASITNTEVLDILCESVELPDSTKVLSSRSGLTDRAFYAYLVMPGEISVPNTNFRANVGFVIKNSEVGYTSLWAIPFLVFGMNGGVPIICERKALLRQVHRGKNLNLKEKFLNTVVPKMKLFQETTAARVAHLYTMAFQDTDTAIERMRQILIGAGAKQEFLTRADAAYDRNAPPNAASIMEAVIRACEKQQSKDKQYDEGALAGALFFKLLF